MRYHKISFIFMISMVDLVGIDVYTISPRDSQVGGAGKIIWLYRGLVITGFTRKSLYSMKLFIFD